MSQHVKSFIPATIVALISLVVLGVLGVATIGANMSPLAPNAPAPGSAHLELVITPKLQEFFAGGTANLTVEIANTGGVPIAGLVTTGSSIASCNRNNLGSLNPGQTTSYTCQKSNVGESSLEVITVSGEAPGGVPYTQSADAFIKVKNSEVSIIKRPTQQLVRPGETARFTIIIFNTSPTNFLSNVKVVDTVPDCSLDPAVPLNLAPGESRDYPCRLDDVQSPQTTVASVQGTNPSNNALNQASDVAWVDLLDLEASLTSNPTQVPEPGDEVTFTVNIANPGSVPVNLVGLTTNKFGNLFDAGNELVPAETNECLPGTPAVVQPFGGSVQCDFIAVVGGQPSDFSVILTALGRYEGGATPQEVSATTSATVKIVDVPSQMEVNLTADPPIVSAPGDDVEFNVRVTNLSEADGVTITELVDSVLGDLDGQGTCELPTNLIGSGGTFECSYEDRVTGAPGDEEVRTVNASGVNDDPVPSQVSASDTITIPVTDRQVQRLFLPQITDDVVEPNNTCNTAYPLQLNRQYFFLPPPPYTVPEDRRQDYFGFMLEETAEVTIELTNFVPRRGQLVVRAGECDSLALVARNPDTALNRILDLGTQAPGQFYIQIINDGPPETKELYGLIVKTE